MKKLICLASIGLSLIFLRPTSVLGAKVTAYKDYEFTQSGQNYQLQAGESFEQRDGADFKMQDASGQVILESLADGRQKFYARNDGYDERVGAGFLKLLAGKSYTYYTLMNNPRPREKQIEVRRISDDKLLGYALLVASSTKEGTYNGWGKPSVFIDSNRDGLVSISELDVSLEKLWKEISEIKQSQAAIATKYYTDIKSAKVLVKKRSIFEAYQESVRMQASFAKELKAAKDQASRYYRNIVIAVVSVALIAALLLLLLWRRLKKRALGQGKVN